MRDMVEKKLLCFEKLNPNLLPGHFSLRCSCLAFFLSDDLTKQRTLQVNNWLWANARLIMVNFVVVIQYD